MSVCQVTDPDQALVEQCQQSDPVSAASFEELHARHGARVLAICRRRMGNFHDAQEAVQETFTNVFRRIHTFRFESSFATWLHRIAVNACIDSLRAKQARPAQSLDALTGSDDGESPPFGLVDERAPAPLERPAHRELQADLKRAVDGLAAYMRQVVELHYYDGLSYDEISARLGIRLGTVKSRMARARCALAHWLLPILPRHSA